MTIDGLACPFCGTRGVLEVVHEDGEGVAWASYIQCAACFAAGPKYAIMGPVPNKDARTVKALKLWERRA